MGPLARKCAESGPAQAVALQFRLAPVFPAVRVELKKCSVLM